MSSGIVVGYDGSDCAREALRVGMEIGKAYGEPVTIAFGYQVNRMAGEVQDYAASVRELAFKQLEHGIHQAQAAGVTVEAVVVEQAPAQALVDLAAERDARVIVVGTRGEAPFRSALIGSTPHKLLHLSDRPVLVVPPPGRES
jgi:nucleotide-binding universal stress UspA family protein